MKSASAIARPLPPGAVPVAGAMLALMAFISWNQSYWWNTLEEDHFGWLTPIFTLYILFDRRHSLLGVWKNCAAADSRQVGRWVRAWVGCLVGGGFIMGLLALVAGAADRAGGGHSFKGTFVATSGGALLILTVPLLAAPPNSNPASLARHQARIALGKLLIFPAFIWLLSEPLVTQGETYLSSFVLGPIAAMVAGLFDLLGLPLVREGNVLLMPDHGRVGVEEACSGIRSFAACVYAGAFLGALLLRRFSRTMLLIAISSVIAFGLNLLRSIFLTAWAYAHGAGSIEGAVHDSAGYVVMGVTIVSLLLILNLLDRPAQKSHCPGTIGPH